MLFPRTCPLCGRIITKEEGLICKSCKPQAEKLLLREPLCKKCGKQLEDPIQEYCFDCAAHPKAFSWGVSAFVYGSGMKTSMMGFKYKDKQEFADYYVSQILQLYGSRLKRSNAQAILPVPLHKKKLRQRGYNQADLIACRLASALQIPHYPDGLLRIQATLPQKNIHASQRAQNLNHAFRPGKLPPNLTSVILTDDIYTTGATMNACAKTLRSAGIKEIICVSVCSTVH